MMQPEMNQPPPLPVDASTPPPNDLPSYEHCNRELLKFNTSNCPKKSKITASSGDFPNLKLITYKS